MFSDWSHRFHTTKQPKELPLCQVTDSFPYSSSVDFTHLAGVIALILILRPFIVENPCKVSPRPWIVVKELFFFTDDLVEYVRLVAECAPNTPLFYYHIPAWTHIPCR